MKISRLTLINIILAALLLGTFLSPLIYSGFRRAITPDISFAERLSDSDQAAAISLQQSYMNIYEMVSPSVVFIRTNVLVQPRFFLEHYRQVEGAGSGFILDNQGYILTNNHVVANTQKIEVEFNDGTSVEATLIGRDESSDLALIKVPASDDFVPATIGDSDTVRPGQLAFAIGAPFGLGSTFTVGTISALGRFIDDSRFSRIQTDTSINPGNSGGPLLNVYGEVIGINQSIVSPGSQAGSVGIGFAVPINEVKDLIDLLKREQRAIGKPTLGVSVTVPARSHREYIGIGDEEGLLVRFVVSGSAAEKAGLRENDFILSVNGEALSEPQDLVRKVQRIGVGGELEIELIRDGRKISITATVGEEQN